MLASLLFRYPARAWRVLLAGIALVVTAQAAQSYRGFTIDVSAVEKQADLPLIIAATQEQIDIVESVGLPAAVLSFLQSVKFEVVPVGTFRSPTPGLYKGRQNQSVQVSAAITRVGHKPVLLHELMHAYHDQRIAHGFKNAEILSLYQQAQTITAYTGRSHMMSNEKEYFACTATAYLFGVTAQEPFNREKIKQNQPACYDYLKNLFGSNAGTYAGSLTKIEPP